MRFKSGSQTSYLNPVDGIPGSTVHSFWGCFLLSDSLDFKLRFDILKRKSFQLINDLNYKFKMTETEIMKKKALVLKFGGASARNPESFDRIAAIVEKRRLHHEHVVVTISAMGDTTEELIRLARSVHPNPPKREYDMLVSAGERVSVALLAMALLKRNIPAVSLTGSQSGIITSSHHSDAKIVEIRAKRLVACLSNGQIPVVAGFQGMSVEGEITTLGRGGTDTTAVGLGICLGAKRIEFFKDVDGIFDTDPRLNPHAVLQKNICYTKALQILKSNKHQVLHERSVLLAQKNGIPLYVYSFEHPEEENVGTIIQSESLTPPPQVLYE